MANPDTAYSIRTVSIENLSSFKNAGEIQSVAYCKTIEQLQVFLADYKEFTILGRGSNSLISPNLKKQPILQLGADIVPADIQGSLLTVGAGMPITRLMGICREAGLSGMDFAAGVPASIGGMVVMNFGCWGQCVADRIQAVQIMHRNGKTQWLSAEEIQFNYRSSMFHNHPDLIVIAAQFRLTPADSKEVAQAIKTAIQQRIEKQPLKAKTFGSIFKNPSNDHAARLIEASGLKGHKIGHAQISPQHANFMCNIGGATYQDAVSLIHHVQQQVHNQTGVQLETEVKLFE